MTINLPGKREELLPVLREANRVNLCNRGYMPGGQILLPEKTVSTVVREKAIEIRKKHGIDSPNDSDVDSFIIEYAQWKKENGLGD